jgi:hypothetical protein
VEHGSSTAASHWPKNSAATIYARAAPDAGFKACCMKSGAYDGSNRGYYFQGIVGAPGARTRGRVNLAASFRMAWKT